MLPPLAAALMKFTQEYEYSWHTPGHTGGTAFLKSPVGRIFFDYFGENLLRSDLSISVGSLGSLLDHTGPDRRAREVRRARVRRAPHVLRDERHVDVEPRDLHGGRGPRSDRAVRPQLPQVDRAQPRDDGRHPDLSRAAAQSLRDHRSDSAGAPDARRRSRPRSRPTRSCRRASTTRAVYSVVTNSTYDGLCYNARRVEELLDPSVDRIHFDEAWYAYARFNPLYRDRHAMHGDPKDHKGPTVFATHSTHKLLAALSQASFLHIRDGRSPIPHARFNESYMLHASTSPLYPIIVSNDITTAMMDGPGGPTLTNESIQEAVAFRQTMGRVHRQFAQKTRMVLQDLERGHRQGRKVRQEGPLRGRLSGAARHRSRVLGAEARRDVARLQRPRGRLLHARPDQGVDRHAGRRRQGRARQARHSGDASSPRTCTIAASRSRRRRTSRFWSCSRSASPKASGARCSTRCSSSSATTTATRRSPKCCPTSGRASERLRRARIARARRPDVRAAARRRGRRIGSPKRSRRCPSR